MAACFLWLKTDLPGALCFGRLFLRRPSMLLDHFLSGSVSLFPFNCEERQVPMTKIIPLQVSTV